MAAFEPYRDFFSLTWTLAMQRAVMEVILDPDTPGGFSWSIARRLSSSSATADMMTVNPRATLATERF